MMILQNQLERHSSPAGKTIRKRRDKRELLARKLKEVVYGKRPAVNVYSRTLQKHLWIINEALADTKHYDGETITLEKLVESISEATNQEFRSSEVQEFRI
jgi:hypothetical protein